MKFDVSSELLDAEPQLGNISLNEDKLKACIGLNCQELQDLLASPNAKKRDALFGKVLRRTTTFKPHGLTMFALDINNLSSITGDASPCHDPRYFMFLAGCDNGMVRYAQPVVGKLNNAQAFLTQARSLTQFVMRHVPIRSPQDQANVTPIIVLRHLLQAPEDLAQLAQSYDLVVDISGNNEEAQRLMPQAYDGLRAQLGPDFPQNFNFDEQSFVVQKLDYRRELPHASKPQLLQFYALTDLQVAAQELEQSEQEPTSAPSQALTDALMGNISIVGTTLPEEDAPDLPDALICLWNIANMLQRKEDYYTSGQGYRSIHSDGINRALQAIATISALTPQCDDQYAD